MFKSIELARKIAELKTSIKAMIDAKEPVSPEKEAELKALVTQFKTVKAAEDAARGNYEQRHNEKRFQRVP